MSDEKVTPMEERVFGRQFLDPSSAQQLLPAPDNPHQQQCGRQRADTEPSERPFRRRAFKDTSKNFERGEEEDDDTFLGQ